MNLNLLLPPVQSWVKARARAINQPDSLNWLPDDAWVGHLAGCVYILAETGLWQVNPQAQQGLKQAYLNQKIPWIIWEQRWQAVLHTLKDAGFWFIPLKGIVLTENLYQDPGLRRMGDIDLLLRPEQYLAAAQCLTGQGFHLHTDNGFTSLEQLTNRPQGGLPAEIILQDDAGLIIELHNHLVSTPWFVRAFGIELSGIWQRALPAASSAPWTHELSLEDQLAHLCLHIQMHGNGALCLHNFLDLDLLIRFHTVEWSHFYQVIRTWRIRPAAFYALQFCHTYLGTPLPPDFFKQTDPGWWRRLRARLIQPGDALITGAPCPGTSYPTLMKLALVERWRDLIRITVRVIWPTAAWRKAHYGKTTSIVQHWVHVAKVILRGD